MENSNQAIANSVSQTSGVTAEDLVKRREGEYRDDVEASRESRYRGADQSPSTVNPFGGVK